MTTDAKTLDERIKIYETLEEAGAPWGGNDDYDLIRDLIFDRAALKADNERMTDAYDEASKLAINTGLKLKQTEAELLNARQSIVNLCFVVDSTADEDSFTWTLFKAKDAIARIDSILGDPK